MSYIYSSTIFKLIPSQSKEILNEQDLYSTIFKLIPSQSKEILNVAGFIFYYI